MDDSRSINIRERAKEAKKAWSGARSGHWHLSSIPAKTNPNSLLLEAVDVARVAHECLGPAKDFDKNAKRAGLLALYKTNEDMVKDFSNNVKDFGDVDVVACTDRKEEFDDLEKGNKGKEGCWCYWADANAQFPAKSYFMYIGKTPPLVNENRATRALVVCVAIEGIRTGKTGRKLKRTFLLEELKRAFSKGFRMWCALTDCGTVGEKEEACFSDMKIPTLFQLTPLNGSANKRKITSDAWQAPSRNASSHLPKRRKLSKEDLQKQDLHDEVWLERRQQLHTLFTLNPAYVFQAHKTYSAQLRQDFDNVIGTKLTAEAVREWEAKLTEAHVVVVPQSSNLKEERKITEVLAEMRREQLNYLGILYYESLQRQKACSAILSATSAGDVPNIKCGVDTKEAFEDAMKVIRSNNMVYAILEADKPSIIFHLDSIRDKLESCIQANTRTGLSQFLSLSLSR